MFVFDFWLVNTIELYGLESVLVSISILPARHKNEHHCTRHKNAMETPAVQQAWLKSLTHHIRKAKHQWRLVGGQGGEFEGEAEAVRKSVMEDQTRRRRMAVLKGRLGQHGLVLKPVEGDGNCQFHALAEVLGEGHDHLELRRMAVDFLEKKATIFSDFLVQDQFRGFPQ